MTADGLASVLAGEHAAVFGYGSAGAVLVRLAAPGALVAAVRSAYDAHRESRDALTAAIVAGGGTPPTALPAYSVPFPLSTPAAVVNFLAGVEDRLCAAAATGVATTGGPDRLRAAGVLSAAAVRAVELRRLGGATPQKAVTPLPGLPGG
jgi:hypothetical protein